MTALSGGDLDEVTTALLEGIVEGSVMGMLYCAIAAITVTSMAAVFMSVVAADSIVSIVVAIRSVMDGDYLNALIHGAFAVVGIIGVCRWYKASYHVTVSGGKGTVSFDGEGEKVIEESGAVLKMDLQFFAKKDLKQVSDVAREIGVNRIEFGNYIHEVKADLGMKANENFSYKELIELAKELLENGGK